MFWESCCTEVPLDGTCRCSRHAAVIRPLRAGGGGKGEVTADAEIKVPPMLTDRTSIAQCFTDWKSIVEVPLGGACNAHVMLLLSDPTGVGGRVGWGREG